MSWTLLQRATPFWLSKFGIDGFFQELRMNNMITPMQPFHQHMIVRIGRGTIRKRLLHENSIWWRIIGQYQVLCIVI